VDQRREALAFAEDDADMLAHLTHDRLEAGIVGPDRRANLPFEQTPDQSGEPKDRGQWRAQFVAYIGEECRLRDVRSLGGAARFVEGALVVAKLAGHGIEHSDRPGHLADLVAPLT